MPALYFPRFSLASLRRQVAALKRRLDRALPQLRLEAAANHITRLWEIAVAKQQPKPDPVDCVHVIADAGFRPESWTELHGYIRHCRRYLKTPDAAEIIAKLFPPGKKPNPSAILINRPT